MNFKFLLAGLLVAGLIVSIIPYSWMTTWSGLIFNALHFPAFWILGYIIRYLSINRRHWLFIGSLFIPLIIELIQLTVGRSADWVDLTWGYLGLLVGYFYRPRLKWLVIGVLTVYVVWLVKLSYEAYLPYSRLPLICDFESEYECGHIRSIGDVPQTNLHIQTINSVEILKISKGSSPWSGLYIPYNWRLDLTEYSGLQIRVRSKNTGLDLDIKFDDGEKKAIYTLRGVSSAWQNLKLPFNHDSDALNWLNIHSISIYVPTDALEHSLEVESLSFY